MSPRTRFFIVVAVAFLLASAAAVPVGYLVSYGQGMRLFRQGARELDAGHYDGAITRFDAASRKNLDVTTMSYVYVNRGWAYLSKGLDEQASRDFLEAIRLNAKHVYGIGDRALAYHRQGEFEKALAAYNVVLSVDRNWADGYQGRASIFANRGDWPPAIADFSEAIRCDPANNQLLVDRGMAFAANNELDSAIANFDAAIIVNPTHAGAYIQRAGAYRRKGNSAKGLADVTEAIRQRPEARQLRYARAVIYLERGVVEEAVADCNEALRLAPDYDLGYSTRAWAESMTREWDKVFSDTATALELNPRLAGAHYLRARAFMARGEFGEAISGFNEALRLEPAFQWALIWRAMNYSYRREYSRALQEFRQTIQRFPRAEAPHLGLAWFLATCPEAAYRNGAEAVAEGLKGCEISYWNNSYAVDVLAAAYAESGDFDQAIQFGELALSMPGSSPNERLSMRERLSLYQDRIAIRDMGGSGDSRNLIDEGVRAYAREDYVRALWCFNAVLPPNPGDSVSATLFHFFDGLHDKKSRPPWAMSERLPMTNAFYYRGLSYQKKREWDNAIADFTTVFRREPVSTLALTERGVTHSLKGQTDKALRDFDAVIRLKPKDALAHALRADTLQRLKQWDAALDAATTAIQLDPGLAIAWHIRGQAYAGKNESEKAAREFSEAIRLDPDLVSSFLARAEEFRAKGDHESVQTVFRETVEHYPRSAPALNALAWFLATCPEAAHRNGVDAVAHAKSACELTRWKDPAYLDTLAAAYAEAGDFDQAIKYATQVLDLSGPSGPDHAEFAERLTLFQQKKSYHAKPPK